MTIDPIKVSAQHAFGTSFTNELTVSVSNKGVVQVSTGENVLAQTSIKPRELTDKDVDPLITFKTSGGVVYTVYDDGTHTTGNRSGVDPVVLSRGSGSPSPATSGSAGSSDGSYTKTPPVFGEEGQMWVPAPEKTGPKPKLPPVFGEEGKW